MTTLIKRYPVASFFILACALSFAGILMIVLPGAIPATVEDAERLFTPVYLAMLAGPSVAGLAIIALCDGREGMRDFGRRLTHWRVGARWYAIALLLAPLAIVITLATLSLFVSDAFLPAIMSGKTDAAGPLNAGNATAFVLTGLAIGLGAGFFEELGWTGVAVPRMLARHGILATGLGVGLVWGAWHFLAIWWGSADAFGAVPVWLYLTVALFAFLPPYRVLMAWVYQHTRSLLVGILMHASLTTSMLLLGPPVTGVELLAYQLTLGAVLWSAAWVLIPSRMASAPSALLRAHV